MSLKFQIELYNKGFLHQNQVNISATAIEWFPSRMERAVEPHIILNVLVKLGLKYKTIYVSQAWLVKETGIPRATLQRWLYWIEDTLGVLKIENRGPIDGQWQTNIYHLSSFLFEEKTMAFLGGFLSVFRGLLDYYRTIRLFLNPKSIQTVTEAQFSKSYFRKRSLLEESLNGKAEIANNEGRSPSEVSFRVQNSEKPHATKVFFNKDYVNNLWDSLKIGITKDPLLDGLEENKLPWEFWETAW